MVGGLAVLGRMFESSISYSGGHFLVSLTLMTDKLQSSAKLHTKKLICQIHITDFKVRHDAAM